MRILFVFLIILILPNTAQAAKTCLPPNHTWIHVPVSVPEGRGIKRILYKHDRDENTLFRTIVQMPGVQQERLPELLLENRDLHILVPTNPIYQTGKPGFKISVGLHGWWYHGSTQKEFDALDAYRHPPNTVNPNYEERSYWTSCDDEHRNTWIRVEFN